MPNLPWQKWYCQDWLSDPHLSMCCPATRGIWKDLLANMILAGVSEFVVDAKRLSRLCRCSTDELIAAVDELISTGTATERQQDGNRIIASRRLTREAISTTNKRKAGIASATARQQDHQQPSAYAYASDSDISSEGESEGNTDPNPRKPYGEFSHVKLSDTEYAKLLALHGQHNLDNGIELLDDYIESKGKRYKSHYAVLKEGSWVWERLKQLGYHSKHRRVTVYEGPDTTTNN